MAEMYLFKLYVLFTCLQYLLRNGITEISRDNFSFSTKIQVGDFYETREGPEVNVSTSFVSSI